MKFKTETSRLCENCSSPQGFNKFELISLTKSQQSYLKTVYEISPSNEGVHISDVATRLEVTKASTCVAMDLLEKKNLIHRDEFRLIMLTQTGMDQAKMMVHRFKMIRQFLTDILQVSQENANADASIMEHSLHMETLCCLCRFIEERGLKNAKKDMVCV